MRSLGTWKALGHQVAVILAKPREQSDVEGLEGVWLPSKSMAIINREMHETFSRARDTLVHELLHALLDISGVRSMLKNRLEMSDTAYEEFEEQLVRTLTPGTVALHEGLGPLLKKLRIAYPEKK